MEQFPGYKVISIIGEGGMATVYKGLQVSLNRPVAIKILKQKLFDRPIVLERFNRESLIIARLNNPNIIHIIDRGVTKEGMPFFVMEYIEGTDLDAAIKNGDLYFNRRVDIVIQICKALAYAHKNGVVHRDIKPSNVLIDGEKNIQVLDFGIAQFYGDEDMDRRHTQMGSIMGTPEYMSPEQRTSADNVTALSDLYSLGALTYELFTGIKPIGQLQLPSKIDPDIPSQLQDIIMSCLESDPANRPASADDIKDNLLKFLRGAHLKTGQKKRAGSGISSIKEKFALLDVIKDENQGSVHLYQDRSNKKLMVIKKRPSKSSGFTEAKLLTTLKHKNIANILGASKNNNAFISVVEYLSGGSLKDRLARPYELDEFLILSRQICEGLSFAHRNRIIHGDLRPSNILFTEKGTPKITDFGLDEHYVPPTGRANWYNPGLESKSVKADILATGVLFYQMLTGSVPEWVDDSVTLSPSFDNYPIELQAMLIQMLSRDILRRYHSFDDVITEIDGIMAANISPERPEADITVLEKAKKDKPSPKLPKPPEPVKSSVMRLLHTIFLLMLLTFVALAYLTYTGDIYYYIYLFKDLLNDLRQLTL